MYYVGHKRQGERSSTEERDVSGANQVQVTHFPCSPAGVRGFRHESDTKGHIQIPYTP